MVIVIFLFDFDLTLTTIIGNYLFPVLMLFIIIPIQKAVLKKNVFSNNYHARLQL